MDFSSFPEKHNYGQLVDTLLQIKMRSRMDLTRSNIDLLELGAKTFTQDGVSCLPNLDLEKYLACNYQEFVWEAEYQDGTILKQFQGDRQHHFGHIDQDKLKFLRWVSLFTVDTSNADKRVIVTLDWETGKFSFYNGLVGQETRTIGDKGFSGEKPKLVLKMVKRESSTVGIDSSSGGEVVRFNRYLLGYEGAMICVEPNGNIHLWDK